MFHIVVFGILLIALLCNLIYIGIRFTWCVWKWLLMLILLPGALICMAIGGLMTLAYPLLFVAALAALITAKSVLPAALFWAGIILLAIGMLTTWYPFAGVIPIYIL